MINRPYTLVEVARAGDLKTIQQLLADKKTDINEQDSKGTTALMAAADGNHAHVVNALLIWGADIKVVDENQMTALMIAAKKGYDEVVYLLVVMRASTEGPLSAALDLAIRAGHINVVHTLLANGANPNAYASISAMEYAAVNNHLEMVRTLLMHNTNIHIRTAAIETVIDRDHVGMVLLLASHEENAGRILNIAASIGNEKMVRMLLANHVKIDAKNCLDYTALMTASEFGRLSIVELLLTHPQASNYTDESKQEALMCAVRGKHLSIVHALLISGAKVNLGDTNDGVTPLMVAINMYNEITEENAAISSKMIRELLILGSDIYLKSRFGYNALDYAKYQRPTLKLINEHVEEQKKYVGIKQEMESFFRGITVSTFFLPAPVVDVVGQYASPTIKKAHIR